MKRNNYWIIADTHFGHHMITKNEYRPEGFEDEIMMNVSKLTMQNDILIHLGDVSFYDNKNWHETFLSAASNCKRNILVLGNHDRETLSWYYDRGWSFVCHAFDLEIYGFKFRFTHRPIECFSTGSNSNSPDVIDFNIHGHLHRGTHREYEMQDWNHLISIDDTLAPVKLVTISEELKGV